ncbi:hypothetical protein LGT39_09085 [Demequina sp. TTPB684]|uniref:hypothetical protein n=1 Tax=unclassified Demequina TaxID=2620311 RepID=UPI001CF31E62|nr:MULTISPECIES: hypothetical protein [unclassified Demequina]MCB2412997.1 hypothetical protein [Demequina sp. TTPB684]UPU87066.1 hypothetical protein LGT36_007165 [Demequina sp. TMPB413]
MKIVSGPDVVEREELPYLAFRDRIPFRGLAVHTAAMRTELARWLQAHPVEVAGPPFLRLHVVDLSDRATVSVAVPVANREEAEAAVAAALEAEEKRIVADAVPPGRFATLTYINHGIRANRLLTTWCVEQGHEIDRLRDETGNTFVARTETYLTDPAVERRASRHEVRLDLKLAD